MAIGNNFGIFFFGRVIIILFYLFFKRAVINVSNQSASNLHICIMAKEDITQNKDCKFQVGMQVSCPYLQCNFKNSQFQSAGRFPSGNSKLNNKHFKGHFKIYINSQFQSAQFYRLFSRNPAGRFPLGNSKLEISNKISKFYKLSMCLYYLVFRFSVFLPLHRCK